MQCDEKLPGCGGCHRIQQECPGYKTHFDLAWRDQTVVAKKGVERGKAKRKAARERARGEKARVQCPRIHAPIAKYAGSAASSYELSTSPSVVFTPVSHGSQRSPTSSFSESPLQRPSTRNPLTTDPYHTIIRPIPEEQALCFFFNNYVLPIRDPLARRGFLEHLGPFYTNADHQSPVKMSTMAIASCLMSAGMGRPPDSPLARSFYIRAVSQLSERVSKQKGCDSDELLVAVMLLQFYEVCHREIVPVPYLWCSRLLSASFERELLNHILIWMALLHLSDIVAHKAFKHPFRDPSSSTFEVYW